MIELTRDQLDELTAWGRVVVAVPVNHESSTVLGYDWPQKDFEERLALNHAEKREKNLLFAFICGSVEKAPRDLHLSVPVIEPGMEIDEAGRYRVRPKWEPGDNIPTPAGEAIVRDIDVRLNEVWEWVVTLELEEPCKRT